MKVTCFTQLEAWKKAHALALEVYKFTRAFPVEERFALVPQMRRAAVSVPANIAEGFARRGTADKARIYNIAQGSAEELKYYLLLCRDVGYETASSWLLLGDACRLLAGLIRSLRPPSADEA